jgi:hypothetical protein
MTWAGVFSTHVTDEKYIQNFVGKPQGKILFERRMC